MERIRDLWPESIHQIEIDVRKGIDLRDLMHVAKNLNLSPNKQSYLVFLLKNLYECFIQRDCEKITINPLTLTKSEEFQVASAKVTIEKNSYYR